MRRAKGQSDAQWGDKWMQNEHVYVCLSAHTKSLNVCPTPSVPCAGSQQKRHADKITRDDVNSGGVLINCCELHTTDASVCA